MLEFSRTAYLATAFLATLPPNSLAAVTFDFEDLKPGDPVGGDDVNSDRSHTSGHTGSRLARPRSFCWLRTRSRRGGPIDCFRSFTPNRSSSGFLGHLRGASRWT